MVQVEVQARAEAAHVPSRDVYVLLLHEVDEEGQTIEVILAQRAIEELLQ